MQETERAPQEMMVHRKHIPAPPVPPDIVPPAAQRRSDAARSSSAEEHGVAPLPLAAMPLHLTGTMRRVRHSRRQVCRALFLVSYDALLVTLSFYAAYYLRFIVLQGVTFQGAGTFVRTSLSDLVLFQVALLAGMLAILKLRGMYRLRATGAFLRQASVLFVASTTCFAGFSIYEFFFRATEFELVKDTRAIVIFTWVTAIVVPFAGRVALALGISLAYRLGIGRVRLLVIGAGRTGKLIMQHLAAVPGISYRVMGFIDDEATGDFGRFTWLGTLRDCERAIRAFRIGEVIIALPATQAQQMARAIQVCEHTCVTYRLVPDIHSLSLAQMELETIEGIPMLRVRRAAHSGWQRSLKRLMDIICAATLLALGAPLWLLLALIIRLDSPGPVIYSQTRIGQGGRPFTSYKFRSMFVGSDTRQADLAAENMAGRGLFKLKHDPRCTRAGRWLRRMSLDEIPQLWNVLRGEMSIVGPRPPLPAEVARYESWEKHRLDVPPGLTGLWQIRGRSDIGFDEMVLMDLYYVENWSLRLDCEILLKTIPVVIFSRGAY